SFNFHSRHDYYYLHAWRGKQLARLRNLDLSGFDVIVLFWDYLWQGALDLPSTYYFIPEVILDSIAATPALKVLFLQDEYRNVFANNEVMRRMGVNVMFTCVAERDHDAFYPRSRIPKLEGTYTVLTGYVPKYLERQPAPCSGQNRRLDIGYRSRRLAFC